VVPVHGARLPSPNPLRTGIPPTQMNFRPLRHWLVTGRLYQLGRCQHAATTLDNDLSICHRSWRSLQEIGDTGTKVKKQISVPFWDTALNSGLLF